MGQGCQVKEGGPKLHPPCREGGREGGSSRDGGIEREPEGVHGWGEAGMDGWMDRGRDGWMKGGKG